MAHDTIVVTGASKGIGLATVRQLVAAGHNVIGLARTRPADPPCEFRSVDLEDAKATAAVLAAIAEGHAVTGLVNNAGLSIGRLLEDTTLEELERHVAVNLRATLQCTQAFVPGMRARGFGRIVNISSRAALGRRGRTAYGATKAGIDGFTRTWAIETAADGITVNSIAPGPVKTELFLGNHPEGSDVLRDLESKHPQRKLGTPEEIAAPICFLLSEAARYVTGQVLLVCGGMSLAAGDI